MFNMQHQIYRLLHYHISKEDKHDKCKKNLLYPSTKQAVDKINYINTEKLYV